MLNTLMVIVEQSFMHLPLILGAYVSFSLLKVPDLSIENAYVFGAITAVYPLMGLPVMPTGIMLLCTIVLSFIGGAVVGLISSILTQKGKFPHLLSSIVTAGVFHGINQFVSLSYVSLSKMHNPLTLCNAIAQYSELPILILIGIVAIITMFFLFKTQIGYAYAVYGNNPQFFKNYNISTSFVFITGIILANGLAGISGYLSAQSNNFLELNMGLGKALLCITALMLGKTITYNTMPFSCAIPISGTFAYFTLQQLLLKVGFNLKYFTAIQAIIVLCILVKTYRKKSSEQFNDNLGL